MTGYEKIKRLAKEKRCKVTDLLVLAQKNDPFYTGTATEKAMAEWFAELWRSFGYTAGVHLRRVHYQFLKLNIARRHLPKEWKQKKAKELREQGWSYPRIGKVLGVNDTTILRWLRKSGSAFAEPENVTTLLTQCDLGTLRKGA